MADYWFNATAIQSYQSSVIHSVTRMKLALSPKIHNVLPKNERGREGQKKCGRIAMAFATPILNPSRIHVYLQWVDSRFAIFSVKTAAKPIKPQAKERREKLERSEIFDRLTRLDLRVQRVNPENSTRDRSPLVIQPYLSYSFSYHRWDIFLSWSAPTCNPISDFRNWYIYIAREFLDMESIKKVSIFKSTYIHISYKFISQNYLYTI